MIYIDTINDIYIKSLSEKSVSNVAEIEILDAQENTIKKIENVLSGNVNINYQQGITRTCILTISNADISEFMEYQKFKIYLGIKYNNDTFLFSHGVFLIKNISFSKNTITISGVDKFAKFSDEFNQGIIQGTYTIPAGSTVRKVLQDILSEQDGRGVFDCSEPMIDNRFFNTKLPYDIVATAGNSIASIIIEMANTFEADVYYNSRGNLIFQKTISDYNFSSIQYDFNTTDIYNYDFNIDLAKVVNSVTISGTDADERLYTYTAQNKNPLSPINIYAIGIRAEAPEESASCYSYERCQDYAEYLLKQKELISCSGRLQCKFIPHLQANDLITVTIPDINYDFEKFLIQSIDIPVNSGDMTINVCNIQYL